jgi:hypothetical protein
MAKYKDLQRRIEELEKQLHMKELEIQDAHKKCDELDVPKSKSGAFVGHRLHWYSEGKRESHKTKENTEGYSPDEWEKRKQQLKDIESGKHIKNKQVAKTYPKFTIDK